MPSHTHHATIYWTLPADSQFLKGRYSREHTWTFDGGLTLPASPSPHVVPAPWSNPALIDPEEAFVAALSSCHMLVFLHLASRAGLEVVSYRDAATGSMGRNEQGVAWVESVLLHPEVHFSGSGQPSRETLTGLHQAAHEQCFIANSVKTSVSITIAE